MADEALTGMDNAVEKVLKAQLLMILCSISSNLGTKATAAAISSANASKKASAG